MVGSKLKVAEYPAHPNNYSNSRFGSKISEITVHHMAGRLSARVCASIFQKPARKASSTYGIGYDGEIAQYVDENHTSWCNSNWESNKRAITIEVANSEAKHPWPVSDKSINSLIKLVKDLAVRHNLYPLVKGKNFTWHSMYRNTTCPGPYLFSKFDYIISTVNKMIADERKPKPEPVKPKPTDNSLKYTVKKGDTLIKIAKRLDTTVEKLVKINNIKDPNKIYPGQVLVYTQNIYVVQKGDTLAGIAKKVGRTVNDLYNMNKSVIGNNPNRIYPGQKFRY